VAKLPERDQKVLTARFGLNGSPPLRLVDTGALLGVGRERARQLEARAIRWTRKALLAESTFAVLAEAKAAAFDKVSTRAWNALKNANIRSLDELALLTRRGALKIKNLGRLTVEELDGVLASVGLTWAPETPEAQASMEAYARRTELRQLRAQLESARHTIEDLRRTNESLTTQAMDWRGSATGLSARLAEAEERGKQLGASLFRVRAVVGPLRKALRAIQDDPAVSEATRAALAPTLARLDEVG
jgi:FtsZ-binding cell division protein ZapB